MNASLLEEGKRLRTVAVRQDEIDAAGLDVAREHRNPRIATRHQNAVAEVALRLKNLHLDLSLRPWLLSHYRVGSGKVPGHSGRRGGHQAFIYAAQLHRLSGLQIRGAGQQDGALAAQVRGWSIARERKELFDGGLKSAGQTERDGGIGHIGSGLHRIDCLAADADGTRELNGR